MMKDKMNRICSFLLVLAMLLPLAACSDNQAGSNDTTNLSGNENVQGTTENQPDTEEAKMLPNLPADLNYNGSEIRIMQHPNQGGDWSDWLSRDLYAESLTGEPINDAVFDRNTYVEDMLNVKLNIIDSSDMGGAIKAQATSGTGDYHISTARIGTLPSIVTGGYLQNLYSMPNMDLSKPWYDEKCIEDASLYNMLFYVTGSMIILDDDSTGAMVFNKQLIENFNLESPYTLVNEGTWTLDKFAEYADVVDSDLNGNGEVDLEEDRFGILWQRDAIISFLHSADCRIVTKNEDGDPEFSVNNERTINLMDKLDSFMFNPQVVQNMHNHTYPDIYAAECNVFKDNRALFMWVRMRVVENLRDMEADFGIIPVPKYDEEQSSYYSTINRYTAGTVCVPNDASLDLEMVGAVIELMSAEGHYGLREAYYEKNLGTKVARDPESTQMLDLIMENRVYDMGELYNIGGFADKLYYETQKSSMGFATLIAKNQKSMNVMLEKSFTKPMKELAEKLGTQ